MKPIITLLAVASLAPQGFSQSPGTLLGFYFNDAAIADFRLQPASAARKAGRWESFALPCDLDGNPRPAQSSPSIGAFE